MFLNTLCKLRVEVEADTVGSTNQISHKRVANYVEAISLPEHRPRIFLSKRQFPGGLLNASTTDFSRNDLLWTGFHPGAPVHRDQSQVHQFQFAAREG
jgi:hypothetical protein